MLVSLLEKLSPWGPLFFGLAFVAPVLSELLILGGVSSLFGLPTLVVGLLVGGAAGFWASRRRSWL